MSKPKFLVLGLLALTLVFAAAAAQAAQPTLDLAATLEAIDQAVADGQIDYEQGLLAKVRAMTNGPLDPTYERLAPLGAAHPQCGTPLILELLNAYPDLSEQARAEIDAALAIGNGSNDAPPLLPDKARVVRPLYLAPNMQQSEHFNIKWGTSNPPTAQQVQDLMDSLETVWDAEVEREGYPQPTNSGSYFVDIYIGNTGADATENIPEIGWAGAYTSIYTTDDYRLEEPEMSYIVIHPDILQYLPAIQEIAAHEFFHVLQFAIWLNNYPNGYFDSESNWWWEATAVWMEDEVFDDVNQYIYFLNYYMENPHKALHEFTSGAPHQYGMCIWAIYLDENYDGNQTIYDLWIDPDPAGILVATDDYLSENYQSDLETAFRDFLAKVSMLDFNEGSSWDQVSLTDSVSEYPYVQDEDEVASKSLPRILGANLYKLRPGSSSGTLTIEFNGQGTYNDNDLDWNVMVLAVPADKADYQVYQIETEDESESGTLQVAGFGSEIDEVWLAFAPFPSKTRGVDKFGTSRGFDYAWAADVSAGDDDDDDDSGDDDDDSGCGC